MTGRALIASVNGKTRLDSPVKKLLKEQGMTQTVMAEKMGISKQALSQQLKEDNPTIGVIKRMATVLNVQISDIWFPDNQNNQLTKKERTAETESNRYNLTQNYSPVEKMINHDRIQNNIAGEIYVAIRSTCDKSFEGKKVFIEASNTNLDTDIMVVTGSEQYHDTQHDSINNPVLIVEVVDSSSEAKDRGDKFSEYRKLITLQEYLIVNSEKIGAEVWRRHDQGYWFLASEAYSSDKSVDLSSIALTLLMGYVYAKTKIVPTNS